MITEKALQPAIDVIQHHAPNFHPVVGMVLGSGLAPLADDIENAITLPYEEIPGMPISGVHGHAGHLVLGDIKGVPVACLKGRVHYYEGAESDDFKTLVRLIKLLGCKAFFITNAAGSLRREIGPGELVVVNDHINLQFRNPLIGLNDKEFGERFFPMDDAYDKEIREKLHQTAAEINIKTHEGVYASVLGPNFETPAEIKAFRTLGADVIGMSTVPEVLVARHCGLRVCVISAITNLSADMSDEQLTHEVTLKYGQMASGKLCELVKCFLGKHGHEF